MDHFGGSIEQILFDEGFWKEIDFRFDIGLQFGFYLKVHIAVVEYLFDGGSIFFV